MEFSALNFEHFRDAQLESCEKRLKCNREESLRVAEKTLLEAELKGKALLEECLAAVEEETDARRIEQGIQAGLEVRREHYASLDNQTMEIRETVLHQLEDSFIELAGCFISWLDTQYDSGSITLSPDVDVAIPLKFLVQTDKERSIRFSKENLFIEFSVEALMQEYAGEINRHIYDYTGV